MSRGLCGDPCPCWRASSCHLKAGHKTLHYANLPMKQRARWATGDQAPTYTVAPSQPVELAEIRLAPCIDVIETLEHALERARSGEMRAVVVVSELAGRAIGTAYAWGDGDEAHLVYGLEVAKMRILRDA